MGWMWLVVVLLLGLMDCVLLCVCWLLFGWCRVWLVVCSSCVWWSWCVVEN